MTSQIIYDSPKNVKLSHGQIVQLNLVARKEIAGRWYLDQDNNEYRRLQRLAARGLVEHTGEGEGRWRVYWRLTPAGHRVLGGAGGGGEPEALSVESKYRYGWKFLTPAGTTE